MSKSLASHIADVFFYAGCATPAAVIVHSLQTTGHTQDWLVYVAVIVSISAVSSLVTSIFAK